MKSIIEIIKPLSKVTKMPKAEWNFADIFYISKTAGDTSGIYLSDIIIDPNTGDPKQSAFDSNKTPVGHVTGRYKYNFNFGIHKKRAIENNIFDVKIIVSTYPIMMNHEWAQDASGMNIPPGASPDELSMLLSQQAEITENMIRSVKDSIIYEETISIRDVLNWTESDAFGNPALDGIIKNLQIVPKIVQQVILMEPKFKYKNAEYEYITPIHLDPDTIIVAKEPPDGGAAAKSAALLLAKSGISPTILVNTSYFSKAADAESGYASSADQGGKYSAPQSYFPQSPKEQYIDTPVKNVDVPVGINSAAKKAVLDLQKSFVNISDEVPTKIAIQKSIPSWNVWKNVQFELDKDTAGSGDLYFQAILIRKELHTVHAAHQDVTNVKTYPYKFKGYTISQATQISDFTEPVLKPSISLYSLASGLMKISVQQRDPWAVGVVIQRIVHTGNPGTDAPNQLVYTHTITPEPFMQLTDDMGPEEITDYIDITGIDNVEYTVWAVGPFPGQNKPFTSVIMKGTDHPEDVVSNAPPCRVTAKINDNGDPRVEVTGLPTGVTHLQVLREIWSNRGFVGHHSRPHKILSTPDGSTDPVLITSLSDTYTFYDDITQMINGYVYRYYVRFHEGAASADWGGDIVLSSGQDFLTYLKPMVNPPYFPVAQLVSSLPYPASIDFSPESYQVALDLTADTPVGILSTKMLSDLMKDLLGPELETTFAQDFKNNKRKFEELAVFHVQRQNLDDPDDRKNCGIWPPGLFKDGPNPHGGTISVGVERQPFLNNRYEYSVELLLRAPDFLFDDAIDFVPTANKYAGNEKMLNDKTGAFFSVLSKQLKQTYKSSMGLTDFEEVSSSNYGPNIYQMETATQFTAGKTGIVKTVVASTVPIAPEIVEIKKMGHERRNKFGWEVQGITAGIHSYLIVAKTSVNGLSAPLAYVPHTEAGSHNETPGGIFTDTILSNEVTGVRYMVHIMHTNYSFTPANSQNSMIVFEKNEDTTIPWAESAKEDWEKANGSKGQGHH
jgi:hypothetical protein